MSPAFILALVSVTSPPADAVLEGLQRSYNSTSSLKASFEQVYTYKVGGLTRTSSGLIFLKKPGRMRFDYLSPSKRHFISDGKVLWVYEPDQAQAFRDSLASSQSAAVLNLLLGGGDLKKDFEHSLLKPGKEGRHRLQLVPRESARTFRKVILTLDPSTFRVMGVEWEDPTGNTNLMRFTNLSANIDLRDEDFDFVPPAGTRVIKAPGSAGDSAPPASSKGALP